MRIWFNKTFSTIRSVLQNLKESPTLDKLELICTHTHHTASVFVVANECYFEPDELTGRDYVQWCVEFCKKQRIDIFWAGKEASLIHQNQSLFTAIGTRVLSVASYDTLKLLADKARFYRELPPSVATVMDFVVVNDTQAFEEAIALLSKRHKQLCVKPAVSVFGLGFRVLDEHNDSVHLLLNGVEHHIPLAELRLGMKQRTAPFEHTLLVMEYMAGHEWSVDCVAKQGQLLCAVQRKKALIAGHGQTIDNNADISGMVERLTAHYQLNGLFNIQFREGEYGVRLLEINSRPSGGVGMACLAGVNLAELALQSFCDVTMDIPTIHYGRKVIEVNKPVILLNDVTAQL